MSSGVPSAIFYWSEHSQAHSDSGGGTQTPSLNEKDGKEPVALSEHMLDFFVGFGPKPSSPCTHLPQVMSFRPMVLQ